MNPIYPALFFLLALVLVAMTWRTIARMWAEHGSPERLASRQLTAARKNELLYRAAAEEYAAAADGYARTVARLTTHRSTTDASTQTPN